jgi:hypothetical protein
MPFFIPAFFAAAVLIVADAPPHHGLAGVRPSWLDGAPAELAAGGAVGTVAGFDFAEDGQVRAIIVHQSPSGPDYAVPRGRIHVIGRGEAAHVVIDMERGDLAELTGNP